MLCVYADSSLTDVKAVRPVSAEFAFGSDENDFQAVFNDDQERLAAHCYLYIDGTECGGMIDDVKHDPEECTMTYTGATWHGLLSSKIIQPDSGADYYTATGDVNAVIGTVLKRVGLDGVMQAPATAAGVAVSGYRFGRYVTAYDGLRAMLATVGRTLSIQCLSGTVTVSSAPTKRVETKAVTQLFGTPTNHLICLGKGELAARVVVHLYADASGNVSKRQTLKGALERCDIYDYNNAEAEELEQKGTERLKEAQTFRAAELVDVDGEALGIDDVLAAYDSLTGISAESTVSKVIASYDHRGTLTVTYKTDDKQAKTETDY